jgi:hypothetical protein
MNLPDKPAIRHAHEHAVACLQIATNATEDQAEAFVDAMATLIFTTMQTYLSEKDINAIDH